MSQTQALIVEDNSLNSEILQTMLEQQGVDSVSTSAPQDIISIIKATPTIRVVFLDLEFPNANGLDVFQQLMNDPEWNSEIQVVAYSVHTSAMQQARHAGLHGFLGKPINPSQFPEQWQKILAGEPVWSR